MKTSNKLLVLLALFFISTLVFFNVLLKAQLAKGNIRYEYNDVTRLFVPLKPFRHVVYDGRMQTSFTRTTTTWLDRTMMVSTGDKCKLSVPSNLEPFISYRYQGDTLFIGFYKNTKKYGRSEYVPEPAIPMQLFAPEFSSISSVGGMMNVSGISQKAPLELYLKSTGQNFTSGLELSMLKLHIDPITKLTMIDGSHIDTMELTMARKSAITLATPINIKTILPVQLDSSARISVEGRSYDMKEYLQKMQ